MKTTALKDQKMTLKTKRVLAALIDMLFIPALAGAAAGFIIIAADITGSLRETILESLVLPMSLIFLRDFVYSPGRHILGLELVDVKSRTRICFYKGNFFLNLWKCFLRSILLLVPFLLVAGYAVELFHLILKGRRIADKWAQTEVIEKS